MVLDARPSSFGIEPLRWLRDDPVSCALVVLAHPNDTAVIEAAELADSAGVIEVSAGARGASIVRAVRDALHGERLGDLLRWVPPRAARLRVPHRAPAMLPAA